MSMPLEVWGKPMTEKTQTAMNKRSYQQIKDDVSRNRQQLTSTLDAIEFRLNFPKRAFLETQRFANKMRVTAEEEPIRAAMVAVAVLGGIGAVTWWGIKIFSRR